MRCFRVAPFFASSGHPGAAGPGPGRRRESSVGPALLLAAEGGHAAVCQRRSFGEVEDGKCQVGVSENRENLNPMVLLIIIPKINGYFIGTIAYFQTNPGDLMVIWWWFDGDFMIV